MGKAFKEKMWDMKVRSITKTEREKEDMEMTQYKLVARDKDGVNEIVITSANQFTGITTKDGVIQVVLKQSQMAIEDFKDKEEDETQEE